MEKSEGSLASVGSPTGGNDTGTLSNFRAGYYGVLGVSGVGEKKSLESILKEETSDLHNLVQYCLLNTLPSLFRPIIWKLLFGILPVRQDVQEFVWQTRLELFAMLRQSVTCTLEHDQFIKMIQTPVTAVPRRQYPMASSPTCFLCEQRSPRTKAVESAHSVSSPALVKSQFSLPSAPVRCVADSCDLDSPTLLLLMLLLRDRQLLCSTPRNGKLINPGLHALTQFLLEILEDEVDTFWCLTGFSQLQNIVGEQLPFMVQLLEQCLEDEDGAFFEHLQLKELWPHIPFLAWFNAFFTDVMSEVCLLSMLDRVAAGCLAVLVYVAAGLMLTVRRTLLACTGPNGLAGRFDKLSLEVCQTAMQRGLVLWEQSGCPLLAKDGLRQQTNEESVPNFV